MTETYFTSDTHFGHRNILEYEKEARPFETVEEMNEQLIANWNDTVRPKDIVFHLGDFAFGAINVPIADRLNGYKRLVMGNHDCHSFDLYEPTFPYTLSIWVVDFGLMFTVICIAIKFKLDIVICIR